MNTMMVCGRSVTRHVNLAYRLQCFILKMTILLFENEYNV